MPANNRFAELPPDTAPGHHPEYNFNDETKLADCSWYAEMVKTRLPTA